MINFLDSPKMEGFSTLMMTLLPLKFCAFLMPWQHRDYITSRSKLLLCEERFERVTAPCETSLNSALQGAELNMDPQELKHLQFHSTWQLTDDSLKLYIT